MDECLSCSPITLTTPYQRGPCVEAVQRALKAHGYDFGPVDGTFGPLTAAAVEMWKQFNNITPVDPNVNLPIYYSLGVRCVGTPQQTEQLDYNNPLFQPVETAWVNGRKYWAFGPNIPLPLNPQQTPVAQEYVIAYSVSHDWPDFVPLQLNIYDSIPGQPEYSPIWHLNYVIVPRSYVPNTLRSVSDVQSSGYPVISSEVYVN